MRLGTVENIVKRRENAGHQQFLLSPQCFQKRLFFKIVKSWECVVKHLIFDKATVHLYCADYIDKSRHHWFDSPAVLTYLSLLIRVGVLCGLVVKCSTRNLGVLGLSWAGYSIVFVGVSLGRTLNIRAPAYYCSTDMNNVSCWAWYDKNTVQPIPTQWHLLTPLGNKPFENTVGKGEIAHNEQFLLYPQCFLPI